MAEVEDDKGSNERLKLNLRVPPGMPNRLAHHLFVQSFSDYVQLSFFELNIPIVAEDFEEKQIALLKERGIDAICVSRINIPASAYPDFVKAMQSVISTEELKEEN